MTLPTMTETIKARFFKSAYEIMETMPEPKGRGRPGKKTEFAKSIGWTLEGMLMVENDPDRTIPLKAIIGICRSHGVDANWLLLGQPQTQPRTPKKAPK